MKVVVDEQGIAERISQLAQEITRDYSKCELVVVGILKGSVPFIADLIRKIRLPLTLDFMSISRYSPSPDTGEVKITKDLQEDVSAKHLLLVEDIVDTGLTLNYLIRLLLNRRPASLAVCTLLDRPGLRLVDLPIRYVGFEINQEFLIGYGLDYCDRYRQLPFLAAMDLDGSKARNSSAQARRHKSSASSVVSTLE
ncbi:MAG: hypoxanthine phosphoribosyltransferase [Acidobacteriota bacterium]